MEQNAPIRLNKHIALILGVSRRQADDLIASGKVQVSGKTAVLGARIAPTDTIYVGGKPIAQTTDYKYLLLNKPVGYVCSRNAQGGTPTIYSLLPKQYHNLKSVGRLDKDSSGLILLTNNGDFTQKMTHPSHQKVKVYSVQLDTPLQPLHQQMISDFGIQLQDGVSRFLVVKHQSQGEWHGELESLKDGKLESESRHESTSKPERDLRFLQDSEGPEVEPKESSDETLGSDAISLARERYLEGNEGRKREGKKDEKLGNGDYYEIHMSEGRNRQIRRTFAALGYTVTALHRTQFGNYMLGDIKSGEYTLTTMR